MARILKLLIPAISMLLCINSFSLAQTAGSTRSTDPAAPAREFHRAQLTRGTERIQRTVRFRKSPTVSPIGCAWSDCRSCSEYRRLCGQNEYVVLENVPFLPMSSSTADLAHSLRDATSRPVVARAPRSESDSVSLQAISRFELKTPGTPADVWAHGNYAYLASFNAPSCSSDSTGVSVIDIFDPSNPVQVAFLPAKQGTRPSDLKVEHVETRSFTGDLLVLSTEPCSAPSERRDDPSRMPVSANQRGLAIWDVTDPTSPSILTQDFAAFSVRSSFVWQEGPDAYMMLVDGDNGQDIHILDITDPTRPTEITVTERSQWRSQHASDLDQASAFANSAWVQKNDALATAYLAYGEAGLVMLDVTDAADPVFLGDSLDPGPDVSGVLPESNCEIARPSEDGRIAVSGDRQVSSMRVLDVSDPSRMVELGSFMLEAGLRSDSSPADGIGSSGVIRDGRAYWSWTRRGIRVIDFSACTVGGGTDSCSPTEIAHFSDGGDRVQAPSGVSQPWSVYVHDHPNGDRYILGSDRTSGLWILSNP